MQRIKGLRRQAVHIINITLDRIFSIYELKRPDKDKNYNIEILAPMAALLGNLRAMVKKNLYRIVFVSQGQVYEIYAREVGQGALFGFIEVEQLVFGERTTLVVDPSEEKIKSEFEHVTRTYLPMHAIIRIDEVDKQGASKITKVEGNVTQFPMPIYTPGDSKP